MPWAAEPSPEIASKLKQLGIAAVAFEPCTNKPESGNFLGIMKRNLERIDRSR